jgi:hypothetical protein
MTARVGVARKLPRSIAVCILVSLLLCSSLSCSRHASPEPVTLTYLDVEWEAPDELSEYGATCRASHGKQEFTLNAFPPRTDLCINWLCGQNCSKRAAPLRTFTALT